MAKSNQILVLKFEFYAEKIARIYDSVIVEDNFKDPLFVEKFKLKCVDLEHIGRNIEECYFSLLSQFGTDADRIDLLKQKYACFEEQFLEIKVRYKSLFPTTSDTDTIKPSLQSGNHSDTNVSLPRINLPHFSGNYCEFQSFINLFDSCVHSNQSLSPVQKKHYLISCLSNEPLNLIKHLSNTPQNYEEARLILMNRYDDKRIIADSHLSAMLSLPTVSIKNLTQLRSFVSNIQENTRGLSSLGLPVSEWSLLLSHIFLRKLDNDLRAKFELAHQHVKIPTFDNLITFLDNMCKTLETSGIYAAYSGNKSAPHIKGNVHKSSLTTTTLNKQTREPYKPSHSNSNNSCPLCSSSHYLFKCTKFINMDTRSRLSFVTSKGLCFNCLRPHRVSDCFSKSRCQICNRKHNTLLHTSEEHTPVNTAQLQIERDQIISNNSNSHLPTNSHSEPIHAEQIGPSLSHSYVSHGVGSRGSIRHSLLATAVIDIAIGEGGRSQKARALLDPGSMTNFISINCVQRLNARYNKSNISVTGIGGSHTFNAKGQLKLYLIPADSNESLCIDTFVLPRITCDLPTVSIDNNFLERFKTLKLADPQCNVRGPIDLLLGAGACARIFQGNKLTFEDNLPTAFETLFGWVLMGDFDYNIIKNNSFQSFSCINNIDETLKRFWEIEEVSNEKMVHPDDTYCENHFKQTHSRTRNGRFVVRLPFKQGDHKLGETKILAVNRLHSLERKFNSNPVLERKYKDFMEEYCNLGHMQPVEISTAQRSPKYYIPHHGVYKRDSDKIRCVFDASLKSSTGNSLNDILLAGPKLQQDIVNIILHFRLHEIVFSADVRQMYRQILIHPDDRNFQLIVWRGDKNDIQEYQLNTVTYGVTSAPFLAMRCVQELASLGRETHPRASRVLQHDIFVDDVVTGAGSLNEARDLKTELISLLSLGGLELRKWISNCPQLLSDLPSEFCELQFSEGKTHSLKILGVKYNPVNDNFGYQVNISSNKCTKREILSKISSIYDPSGWLAPCIINVKILIQVLWKLGVTWDQLPPESVVCEWQSFCNGLHYLANLSIPRQILSKDVIHFDLHGFSDASDVAYAACVYMRCVHSDGRVTIHLLISKTRVAPIKQKLTIPKLELSGALLLARLMNRVYGILASKTNLLRHKYAWSDSSIVLCWLRTEPHLLKVFESHRVSEIQNILSPEYWRYVPSGLNPADCASRGIPPQELVNHNLWWGPVWLLQDEATWPEPCEQLTNDTLPGIKKQKLVTTSVTQNDLFDESLILKFSSFNKLNRITAWCLRFVNNCRTKTKMTGHLCSKELENSLLTLVKLVQYNYFKDDINLIKTKQTCSTGLRRLHPFIDNIGMLRVGGRLVHSSLTYTSKYPLVLPHSCHFTSLLIDYYHLKFLHAGPNLLMSLLREKFWILSARRVIRTRVFKCIRCFRFKCTPPETLMGNLPSNRVTQSYRPFLSIAIDFTGHFNLKMNSLRNARTGKAYVCVFVCFTTKAVHLELVSDLTAEAFLAALRRFVGRRGLPKEIRTDSGTNFKGASNILKRFAKDINVDPFLKRYLSEHVIEWTFSPPLSPHFNGLVEAAVKSCKSHLKRVIGDRNLTFEELTTVLVQIESILNSRPLGPMSSDPNDLSVLTPGHFIIGAPLIGVPELPIDNRLSLISRWHLLQSIVTDVWKRWSHEYLHTLQQRNKWNTTKYNIKVNDLVLLKEDNLPPLQWCMGRVIKVLPGQDSVVRVVEIKTAKGLLTRSLSKICPLPCNNID